MTVNIKLCGGCNPRYERGAFARRLIEAYPNIRFLCNAEETTDASIILCGCHTACAADPKEYKMSGILIISDEDMWSKACSFLDRF